MERTGRCCPWRRSAAVTQHPRPLRSALAASVVAALDQVDMLDGRDTCDIGVLDSTAEDFEDGLNDHQIPISIVMIP